MHETEVILKINSRSINVKFSSRKKKNSKNKQIDGNSTLNDEEVRNKMFPSLAFLIIFASFHPAYDNRLLTLGKRAAIKVLLLGGHGHHL